MRKQIKALWSDTRRGYMKKIKFTFLLSLSLQLTFAHGADPADCQGRFFSLTPFDYNKETEFAKLASSIKKIGVCDDQQIFFKKEMARDSVNHDMKRCEAVKICSSEKDEAKLKTINEDAAAQVKETIPKAVLLAVIDNEIQSNLEYNSMVTAFEKKYDDKICPAEEISPACSEDIRKVLSSVDGSFVGYFNFQNGPDSDDPIDEFFAKEFFAESSFSKIKRKDRKSKMEELAKTCEKRISFSKICKIRDERLKTIADCEKNPESKNCLYQEQNALSSLLNSQKDRPEFFLAMEKQLCTSTRIVQREKLVAISYLRPAELHVEPTPVPTPVAVVYGPMEDPSAQVRPKVEALITMAPKGLAQPEAYKIKFETNPLSSESLVKKYGDSESVAAKANEEDEIATRPLEKAESYIAKTNNGEARETINNNESFSRSISDNAGPTAKNSGNTNWNSDFASRFNSIAAEQEANEKANQLAYNQFNNNSLASVSEKKKKEELGTVASQVDMMKEKLDEMNKNVEDLKAQKEAAEKELDSVEKDKSISELKSKIADLESDKKDIQAGKIPEDVKKIIRENAIRRESASNGTIFSNVKVNEQVDTGKREFEKSPVASSQSSVNYAEPRAAVASSAQFSNTNSVAPLVLHTGTPGAGVQTTADSSIIFMTAKELQKYPFRLDDKASSVEIEKMLLGNKGAAIIIGNDEQIIPDVVKGIVQLDEKGHIKYKKVKISLVKNDKDREKKITSIVSSNADFLKREDQKTKDNIVRKREMDLIILKARGK
jgi:hypothetical protein